MKKNNLTLTDFYCKLTNFQYVLFSKLFIGIYILNNVQFYLLNPRVTI